MKAAPQAQQLLLDLQAIDTSTAQIRHRRQTLPEIAELQQKQAVRARLGEEVVAVKTRLSDLDSAQAKVEADLVPVRERLARNRQRVDAGAISDPKALQAMLGEIEHLDGRIDELEYQQLELMEEIDGVQRELDEASARKIDVENEMRTLIASRDEKFAVLDAELAQKRQQREATASQVPADLLALYEKIGERVGGAGAALLRQGRCGGCQLQVTSVYLEEIRNAAPDEVLRCEECQRILVRTDESGL